MKHANEGRLLEAETLCRTIVDSRESRDARRAPALAARRSTLDPVPSIPDLCGAYYLLGVVHDARGEGGHAENYFRKALYLEPNHYEALMQLALQREKNGDAAGARVLRQRAGRTKKELG
jgi:chemotaxis protein methyltransferase WspC